jgi:catechol 2,3-dioxygenase-like lactoylglutathione lyase family enzyme
VTRLPLLLLGVSVLHGCQCFGTKSSGASGDRPTTDPTPASPSEEPSAAPAAAPSAAPVDRTASLLGGERGLDHVGVGVKSLEKAARDYQDILGFGRPIEGKLPNGIKNMNYYFGNATYLETLGYWDRSKAKWLTDFTDKHEGGVFAALSAFSHDDAKKYLAGKGKRLGNPIDGTIQTTEDAMPAPMWQTFYLENGTLPGDPFFFIAYRRDGPDGRDAFLRKIQEPEIKERGFRHKNTALGLHTVWIAVQDLAAAKAAYESIGLSAGRTFDDAPLGAKVQAIVAGIGEIWLMAPSSPDGKVAEFLRERRAPSILGVTIEVGSVGQAAKVIGEHLEVPTYEGALGPAIRVGPEAADGVYIEFTHTRLQRPPAAATPR